MNDEEIVYCRDCYYCHEVGRFFVCKRFNYKIDTNTGEHEARGFCAWGVNENEIMEEAW